jgi:transcriptional regulator GlxA family with amidase domain
MKNLLTFTVMFFAMVQIGIAQGKSYYCPPCNNACDELVFDKPGKCPHCHMTLTDIKTDILNAKKMKIAFYLQDGVEVLDFAGPMEVFSYAGFEVFTVSKTKAPIKSQGILKITPDYSIEDAPQADILAFFGGNAGTASEDIQVTEWIKRQDKSLSYYFSVCTGVFILAKTGYLEGLTVTTFHESIESLRKQYPNMKVLDNVRFVDNGRIITTAGISAGIDGALHLVTKIKGAAMAKHIVEYMEYDKWKPGEGKIMD